MAESSVVDAIADNLVDKDVHSCFIIDWSLSSLVPTTSKMLQFLHGLAVEGTLRAARTAEQDYLPHVQFLWQLTTASLAELGKHEDVDNWWSSLLDSYHGIENGFLNPDLAKFSTFRGTLLALLKFSNIIRRKNKKAGFLPF
jgi:hypothetical protein